VHSAHPHPGRGHAAEVSEKTVSELDLAEAGVFPHWAEHNRAERMTTLPVDIDAVRPGCGELGQPSALSPLAASLFSC